MSSFIIIYALRAPTIHPSEDKSLPSWSSSEEASTKGLPGGLPLPAGRVPLSPDQQQGGPSLTKPVGRGGRARKVEELWEEGRVWGALVAGETRHPTGSHPTVTTMGNSGAVSKDTGSDVSIWTAPGAAAGEQAGGTKGFRKSSRRRVSLGRGKAELGLGAVGRTGLSKRYSLNSYWLKARKEGRKEEKRRGRKEKEPRKKLH